MTDDKPASREGIWRWWLAFLCSVEGAVTAFVFFFVLLLSLNPILGALAEWVVWAFQSTRKIIFGW